LEDRTGQLTNSDFDDMYDRQFFHVARAPGRTSTRIYEMSIRASRHRSSLPLTAEPIIQLDFMPDESLGTVWFLRGPMTDSVPMGKYLKKTAFFGGSLSRRFVGSDGREYKWGFQTHAGQEWSCTTGDDYLVAHYDLKPANVQTYDVSGNSLTIYEGFQGVAAEILATLVIMRHIAQFRL